TLLRRHEHGDGLEDVRPQQARQLPAGGGAVVGLDRVADVGLVSEQARLGGLQVGQVGGEVDDHHPRPGDVVLPQLVHRGAEGDGLAESCGDLLIEACACSACPAEKSRTTAALSTAAAAASASWTPRPRVVFRVMLDSWCDESETGTHCGDEAGSLDRAGADA